MKSTERSFGTLLRGYDDKIDKDARAVSQTTPFEIPPEFSQGFDGRKVWGKFLSPIYDQGKCSSCYAFAVVGCLADKYALQTLLQVKPVFNPLEIVMCKLDDTSAENYIKLFTHLELLQQEENIHLSQACKGDTIYNVGRYIYRFGALEEKCTPIEILEKSLANQGRLPVCSLLEGEQQDRCFDEKTAQRPWPIWSFYTLAGGDNLIKNLQAEVVKWGPITVAFNIYPDFMDAYDGRSVYIPKPGQHSVGGHAVRLVGWGDDGPVPYWICANSWGTSWGENGYFKIVRGNTMLALELNHMGIWPQLPGQDPSQVQYPIRASLMSIEDQKERAYTAVDPINFYPARLIPLIKSGELKGDLSPRFDAKKFPTRATFYAYKAEKGVFMAMDGSMVSVSINAISSIKRGNKWIIGVISIGLLLLISWWIISRSRATH